MATSADILTRPGSSAAGRRAQITTAHHSGAAEVPLSGAGQRRKICERRWPKASCNCGPDIIDSFGTYAFDGLQFRIGQFADVAYALNTGGGEFGE